MIIKRLLLFSRWNSSFFENRDITDLTDQNKVEENTVGMGFCSSAGFAQTQPGAHFILLYHTAVSDHTHYFPPKLQKKHVVLEYLKESYSYVISVFVRFIFSIANSFSYVPSGYMQGTVLCRIVYKQMNKTLSALQVYNIEGEMR